MSTEVTSSQLFQMLGSLYAEVKMLSEENAFLRKKVAEAARSIVESDKTE